MEPMERIQRINEEFQKLLDAPAPAKLVKSHEADELMVWFLLGGKDVGKSTFLHSLLSMNGEETSTEEAEGTSHFVAYVHASGKESLQKRLAGLDVEVTFLAHQSDAHRRLCLIDSPDFDSRYERHARQVKQVLSGGVADGAVLLASPAKYKDQFFWDAFGRLAGAISTQHILFALTKADELSGYLEEVRTDFAKVIQSALSQEEDAPAHPAKIFTVDSLHKEYDFGQLEAALFKKLSVDDVQKVQEANSRQALTKATADLKEHYQLEKTREQIKEAMDEERVNELFEEHFPEAYFLTVQTRLEASGKVKSLVRSQQNREPAWSLAGLSVIQSFGRKLTSWIPWGGGGNKSKETGETLPDMQRLTKWNRQPLATQIPLLQTELMRPLVAERSGEQTEETPAPEHRLTEDLEQLFEDLLLGQKSSRMSVLLRLAINLPVYMYLAFFTMLLLFPLFLLLSAWDLLALPRLAELITLGNVKVSVIGFLGYYIMAVFYVTRKQRDRAMEMTRSLSSEFALQLPVLIRETAIEPLVQFAESFQRLEEKLERLSN